jgi:hypothetical protein
LNREIKQVNREEIESHQLFSLIEDLNIKLAIFLKMYHEINLPLLVDTLPIRKEWLDQHTWQLLITGLEVADFLQTSKTELDYSASAICLAKMFEQEINNSIVHWVRKEKAIKLPQYYNQVLPRVSALVTPNFPRQSSYTTPVNLNKSKNGSWQPPELGKSMNIAKYNIKKNEWATMGIKNANSFLEEWGTIHSIRNKAAHTDEVTVDDFKRMKESLMNLAKSHALEKLAILKNNFKGVKG